MLRGEPADLAGRLSEPEIAVWRQRYPDRAGAGGGDRILHERPSRVHAGYVVAVELREPEATLRREDDRLRAAVKRRYREVRVGTAGGEPPDPIQDELGEPERAVG